MAAGKERDRAKVRGLLERVQASHALERPWKEPLAPRRSQMAGTIGPALGRVDQRSGASTEGPVVELAAEQLSGLGCRCASLRIS